jgi:hypothetical protein
VSFPTVRGVPRRRCEASTLRIGSLLSTMLLGQ